MTIVIQDRGRLLGLWKTYDGMLWGEQEGGNRGELMSFSILQEERSKHQQLGQAMVTVWVDQGGSTQRSSARWDMASLTLSPSPIWREVTGRFKKHKRKWVKQKCCGPYGHCSPARGWVGHLDIWAPLVPSKCSD